MRSPFAEYTRSADTFSAVVYGFPGVPGVPGGGSAAAPGTPSLAGRGAAHDSP